MKTIIGCRKGKKYNQLNCMADFCIDALNLQKSKLTLFVITKTGLIKNTNLDGMCFYTPGLGIIMCIDASLKGFSQCLTFAHEMIHVKQFARGILKMNDDVSIWRGQIIKNKKYNELPWEIQALEQQNNLAKKLFEIL